MKRVFAAVVVLLFIIGVCIAESIVTNSFESRIDEYIALLKAEKNNGNNELCEKYSDEMIKLFEQKEEILILFSNKDMIDDIERSAYRIKDYNQNADKTIFLSEISVLETEIKELKRSSGFYFSSIF